MHWSAQLIQVLYAGTKFLFQPEPGKILSPIDSTLQLNCTVNQGFIQSWRVWVPGIRHSVSTIDPIRIQLLINNYGIQVRVSSSKTSQLIFTGTVSVEATVKCTATAESDYIETHGNRVEVVIYGTYMQCIDNTVYWQLTASSLNPWHSAIYKYLLSL